MRKDNRPSERRKDRQRGQEDCPIPRRVGMTLRFVVYMFVILVMSMLVSFLFVACLHRLGLLETGGRFPWQGPLLAFSMTSVIMGCLFSWMFSKRILSPFREIIDAVDRLADGDFKVRLHLTEGLRESREMAESFNHMAEELDSLEMLRSDFVNNFSHEFKTPIASIRGFARMLQREDLSREERQEYLEIIMDESERLTRLATNVLNLSKIENQTILTGQTWFNCTEQIRRIIALLEPKWSKKKLRFLLEADEITIYGNMELLEQVWINLLDNAIKFSPDSSVISLLLRKRPGCVLFTITDQGPGIAKKAQEHIFDKFYQADSSHAVQGNGLGLTIAQKKSSSCIKEAFRLKNRMPPARCWRLCCL
ncbi:MAG: HAMP domain-containing sensor histidine kinase [Lachnospiraceae bacterium]|nr:HAMP domain-containing sensor histidine kinase [Lachnospiraceae bacterium]